MLRDPDQDRETYWIIGTVNGGGWSCSTTMFQPGFDGEIDPEHRGGIWNSVPAQMEWIDKTLNEDRAG